MRAPSEVYKGIEFVRLYSLPVEQSEKIRQSLGRDRIIKILKEETLLTDCIQYSDYLSWYHESYRPETMQVITAKPRTGEVLAPVFKIN